MPAATVLERSIKIAKTYQFAHENITGGEPVPPDLAYSLFQTRHPEEVYPTAERSTESRTIAVNTSEAESRREFWSYVSTRCVGDYGMLARVGGRGSALYRWVASEPTFPVPPSPEYMEMLVSEVMLTHQDDGIRVRVALPLLDESLTEELAER